LVRGNVTSISQWDTSDIDNDAKTLTSLISYNAAGSVLSSSDPLGHTTNVIYEDKFAANGITLDQPLSFATWAYPTKVIDPDGYSSSIRYKYDFGAPTWKQTPKPNEVSNTPGPEQKLEYDPVTSRLQRVTSVVNNAYTRYEYGPNYVQTYSTINTLNQADEASYAQVFDGVGRVIASAQNHPTLNGGGYSAVITVYDLLGRAIRQSNPTDTSTAGQQWPATGDDATNGWIYTQRSYDWKGRPLLTTNPSITGNPNDTTTKEATYSACGCAGSEVVTLEDEVGRIQKIYSDALGRDWKTEIMDGTSVYSTKVGVYDGRDQVIRVKQYAGNAPIEASSTNAEASCLAPTCQESALSYDGYGRLKTKHAPQQDANTHTTWVYDADDTILSVTDARGASATYDYNNNRRLVSHITYEPGSSGVDSSDVTFEYDIAGNRKLMIDGLGSTTYVYDQFSRLKVETRAITALGSYPIGYDYNLAGELTSLTDPFGQSVSYNHDSAGRLNEIKGTGFPNVSQFASNVHYRAWGGVKEVTYGNGKTLSIGFNSLLAPASFQIPGVLDKTYQYLDNGSLKSASDLLDNRYDRAMQYDQFGRLAAAQTGTEARGGSTPDGPLNQTYQYDAFDHTIGRTSRQWTNNFTDSGNSYQDERHNAWTYDANGNVTNNTDVHFTYDAAGLPTLTDNLPGGSISANGFDGDGQRIKSAFQLNSSAAATTKYYLRATPLGGQVIADILSSGEKAQGYIYAGNELMAVQRLPVTGDSANYLVWRHVEPSGSMRGTDESGGQNWAAELNSAEFDATGVDVKREDPGPEELNTLTDENNPDFHAMGNPSRLNGGCKFNGMPIADCGFLMGGVSLDQFNLVEAASESSKPKFRNYSVSMNKGRFIRDFGLNESRAISEALETGGTLVYNWLVTDTSVFTFSAGQRGQAPRPQTPTGAAKGGSRSTTPCSTLVRLDNPGTDAGVLTRLLFQESTMPWANPSEHWNEMFAIAASVLNRVDLLGKPGLKQSGTMGFGNPGASISDVIYARGNNPSPKKNAHIYTPIGTQYAGFTPDGIDAGIQETVDAALKKPFDDPSCVKLFHASLIAQMGMAARQFDPFNGQTFFMRTSGHGKPFSDAVLLGQFGKNSFFGLKR
jgi:YD repeat-containing protein